LSSIYESFRVILEVNQPLHDAVHINQLLAFIYLFTWNNDERSNETFPSYLGKLKKMMKDLLMVLNCGSESVTANELDLLDFLITGNFDTRVPIKRLSTYTPFWTNDNLLWVTVTQAAVPRL
jgi:hypothetical protein